MKSREIRKRFIEYFKERGHVFVPPIPIVVKNDPTLMFVNAGMNQFKDIFLGYKETSYKRAVNSQKCLRVSGKHNDLEEVGYDTYHHTLFEMLGNWSFGDYFKKEAIYWAYDFLTNELNIDRDLLYATYFEGDDTLESDDESRKIWLEILPPERVIKGSRKDNFWEMGEIGPCGPCSEIHIDLRPENERKKKPGYLLVNKNFPNVIEIWNLVFIQFNREKNGNLVPLPQKHVDTGMGLERLCAILQNKISNYETDLFLPIINKIEDFTNLKYGENDKIDVAFRVIADHLRAISFIISDGQLPSNTGAGYVARRILRRAVRFAFSYLNKKEPFIYKLVPSFIDTISDYFLEIKENQVLIEKVIYEEEEAFLETLDKGMKRYDFFITNNKDIISKTKILPGKFAFELYDTYGFPLDLTQLIAREDGFTVDLKEFNQYLEEQKQRSKKATALDFEDWIVVNDEKECVFCGYDKLIAKAKLLKYRKVKQKNNEYYHLVFSETPFYPESGGQVGDNGWIIINDKEIEIIDTKKEFDLIIHITKELPPIHKDYYVLKVNKELRKKTEINHSATHLLHYALRKILGLQVEQKGSLVTPEYLRFDFSFYRKLTLEELNLVEKTIHELIWQNISLEEKRNVPYTEALKMGALALFGEKYGDYVRIIKFGPSIELCGGTHVKNTSEIGLFKIISEQSIAFGIRRIEAVTNFKALEYLNSFINIYNDLSSLLNSPKDIIKAVEKLKENNKSLQKKYEQLLQQNVLATVNQLLNEKEIFNGIGVIVKKVNLMEEKNLKDIALSLVKKEKLLVLLATVLNNKVHLIITINDELLTSNSKLNASDLIKEIAPIINGKGGGQKNFAIATGTNINKLNEVLVYAKEKFELILKN